MRFKGTKLSNRTVALFAAAILLLSSGGFLSVKAAPLITGQYHMATMQLDTIAVDLYKDGTAAGEGNLLGDITTVNPGKAYNENISVCNSGNAPAYVRLVVRKYWTHKDKNNNLVKDTEVSPGLIELTMADGWELNKSESTSEKKPAGETSIYYFTGQLQPLTEQRAIQSIRVSDEVLDKFTVKESDKSPEGKIVYTYTYDYNGYSINIEAEAQAVQTHNANGAIKSVWGVDNVTESGNKLVIQ